MVTVDLEVMTLTGVHVYRKDRNCSEKRFLPWSKENTAPPEFLRKVRETQGERSKEFLESILDQGLEPNFRPKPPCKYPELADRQTARRQASIRPLLLTAIRIDRLPATIFPQQLEKCNHKLKNGPDHNRHIEK